jgi:hypothetical protein
MQGSVLSEIRPFSEGTAAERGNYLCFLRNLAQRHPHRRSHDPAEFAGSPFPNTAAAVPWSA